MFPGYVRADFAPHHLDLMEWAWEIEQNVAPRPFVAIWPRGGAKSTLAEIIVGALGLRGKRKYCLYVSETQAQADRHTQSIAGLLESDSVEASYPEHGKPKIGKFGNLRGWRRDRLWTDGGFVADGFGLDVAARGAKVDEHRPDVIVLDDLDSENDTPRTTQRKLDLITRSILPAGTKDVAVLGVQNLITPDGIFAQLSDGRADFLSLRILSGPIPAVRDLKTERVFDEGRSATGTSSDRACRVGRGRTSRRVSRSLIRWGSPRFSWSTSTTCTNLRAPSGRGGCSLTAALLRLPI